MKSGFEEAKGGSRPACRWSSWRKGAEYSSAEFGCSDSANFVVRWKLDTNPAGGGPIGGFHIRASSARDL